MDPIPRTKGIGTIQLDRAKYTQIAPKSVHLITMILTGNATDFFPSNRPQPIINNQKFRAIIPAPVMNDNACWVPASNQTRVMAIEITMWVARTFEGWGGLTFSPVNSNQALLGGESGG